MSINDIQEELIRLYQRVAPYQQHILDEVYDTLDDINDDEQTRVRNTMLYSELVNILLHNELFFSRYPNIIRQIITMFRERVFAGIPLQRHIEQLQQLLPPPRLHSAPAA